MIAILLPFMLGAPPETSPVPAEKPDAPALARDKDAPKEWDRKAIAKAMPYSSDAGPVHILTWEIKEEDQPHRFTRCLVVKKLEKPTDKGERWVLGALYSDTKGKSWDMVTIWLTPDPDGKTPPAIWGYEFYRDRPVRSVVLNFLNDRGWTFGYEKSRGVTAGDEHERWIVTRLIDGGVCASTWKAVLGYTAPDFFATLPLAPMPRVKQ
jgi:hypothetical protein